MNDNWRFTTKSVTKYDPAFRDENGYYKKVDWIGFFEIGQIFDDQELTFELYLITEEKYIKAAILFFRFHNCNEIIIRSVEKKDFSDYKYDDKSELMSFYNRINEGLIISEESIGVLVKLILRELVWAELFCKNSEDIALRFGYDFYMYFNSTLDMAKLFDQIKELGLYID